MTERRILRLAGSGALAFMVAAAACTTSCSIWRTQAPQMHLPNMQLSPAAAGSCEIDAVKMCQVIGGSSAQAPQPAPIPMASSNAPPSAPESLEFQIPLGQVIKLMCYYDPQHNSVYRADASAQSALTVNSVEYLRQREYCIKK